MNRRALSPYDEVPYPARPILWTHPDRLAAVAAIFGFEAAPVERCRVLELGCSDGANLLSMAVTLPASEFVGVDLSGEAVARGQAMIGALRLHNIVLRQADLVELASDYGRFDYILVHGLYSWVRREVRDQILAICQGSLAPQGIAYISYNTLPGCHRRLMLREMMLFHNRDFKDPRQRIQQAMTLTKLLANAEREAGAYAAALREEFERISKGSPEVLYHDELGEVYEPVYFHQFIEHAGRYDLQFLCEAEFPEMQPKALTPSAREVLEKLSDDILLKEQYLDFMRGRSFRRTLLCHREAKLEHSTLPERVRPLFVSCIAAPDSRTPDFSAAGEESFRCGNGAAITTTDPLARAMLWHLIEVWPGRIPVEQLFAETEMRARDKLGFVRAANQDVATDLTDFIFAMYGAGLLDLHVHVPPFVSSLSAKPVASPLARLQARQEEVVTTLTHRSLHLPEAVQRGLVMLMDGTRDLKTLKADLVELLRTGGLAINDSDGKPPQDPEAIAAMVEEKFPALLAILPRMAILMA